MAAGFAPRKASSPKYKFEGHKGTIWCLVFLHDNIHIVSGSLDGTMRKWNCNTGRLIGKPWKGEGGDIVALALSPDGKTIACGRVNAKVQRWTTDGKIISNWKGHGKAVRSVSWSPNGDHIASGSDDGTIFIRKAGNGRVEVGPIQTRTQYEWWDEDHDSSVWSLSYSPSGERIASGGSNCTICIWNAKTGERVVGPIRDLGNVVTSVVWSSDGSKIYSASDTFARVFDSQTGELLHRYAHDDDLYSIALSPKNNVLVCVGWVGIAQLWNTESHQPLGKSFCQDRKTIRYVAFSQDGRHLAYGGYDGKLTLWMVDDIAPELTHQPESPSSSRLDADAAKPSGVQDLKQGPPQEARPESPSSFLDVDATGGDGIISGVHDDPYNNFFPSSQTSLPAIAPQPPNLSSARRFWNTISRRRSPTDLSVPRERPKRGLFARRARSKLPPELTTNTPNQPTPEGKVGAGEETEKIDQDVDPGAIKPGKGKDEQREGSLAVAQGAPKLESEENRNLWKRLMSPRGKDPTSVNMAPEMKRPEVVEVYPVRGFQICRNDTETQEGVIGGNVQRSSRCNSYERLVTAARSIFPSRSCTGLYIVASLVRTRRAINVGYTRNPIFASCWRFILTRFCRAITFRHHLPHQSRLRFTLEHRGLLQQVLRQDMFPTWTLPLAFLVRACPFDSKLTCNEVTTVIQQYDDVAIDEFNTLWIQVAGSANLGDNFTNQVTYSAIGSHHEASARLDSGLGLEEMRIGRCTAFTSHKKGSVEVTIDATSCNLRPRIFFGKRLDDSGPRQSSLQPAAAQWLQLYQNLNHMKELLAVRGGLPIQE
ncbi:quinon protein alcohol dehydrogenase-like superfamily [Suillus lakei]|nr:quinon protein alcohol dehydrogenase-like superfamily [Suillus lakei]